jgi:acyl-CoA thioesterase YciA
VSRDPVPPTPEPPLPRDRPPAIRVVMMPRDTNALGTIFGGVILSHIDLAAAIEAHRYHSGRVATVAMDKVVFKKPVFVGDLVSLYTESLHVGTTSLTVKVSVFAQRRFGSERVVAVTEAVVTMVALDEQHRKTPLERRTPNPL